MHRQRTSLAVSLLSLLAVAAPAMAQTDGYLRLDSQEGDWVGGGQLRAFDSDDAAFSAQYDGSMLGVNVFPFDGGFWFVTLAAPPGQPLEPGIYENAVRASFRPPGQAGIDVAGDGRGCNTTSGRFEVTEAVYGPNNYVERFAATFEQHCESPSAPALFGEIRIQNPPPPAPLELHGNVDSGYASRISGDAILRGTLTCNKPADTFVNLTLTQRVSRTQVARASIGLSVFCDPSSPSSWTATLSDANGVAFHKGYAEAALTVGGFDPAYGTFVTESTVQVIRLTKP